jgi:chaperonin GroEL
VPVASDQKPLKTVFVIMPFRATLNRSAAQLTSFFKYQLQRPIEAADTLANTYTVKRSGEAFAISDEIVRDLYRADIVLADLSGTLPNPNVMYELGVRLSVSRKPVILIRAKDESNERVFDVDGYFTFEYDPLDYAPLEEHLVRKLGRLETGEDPHQSPVLTVLGPLMAVAEAKASALTPVERRASVASTILRASEAVGASLGPLGRPVLSLSRAGGHQLLSRGSDLVANLANVASVDPTGVALLMGCTVGLRDFTKTAVLVGAELIDGVRSLSDDPIVAADLKRHFALQREALLTAFAGHVRPAEKSDLLRAATMSCRDRGVAETTFGMVDGSPEDAIFVVDRGMVGSKDEISRPGMEFDRGVVSEAMIPDEEGHEVRLDNACVLIADFGVKSLPDLLQVMEHCAREGRPLLMIVEGLSDEARDTMIVNARKGTLRSVAVRPPAQGKHRDAWLGDLAVYCGARLLSRESGDSLASLQPSDLGTVKQAVIDLQTTRLSGGAGAAKAVEARLVRIRRAMREAASDYERERHAERLARLSGALVRISVGGETEEDLQRRQLACGQALQTILHSRGAGVVLGGGRALADLAKSVSAAREAGPEAVVAETTRRALLRPMKSLATLARVDEARLTEMLEQSGLGFDARTGESCVLEAVGILDEAGGLREALAAAFNLVESFVEARDFSPVTQAET